MRTQQIGANGAQTDQSLIDEVAVDTNLPEPGGLPDAIRESVPQDSIRASCPFCNTGAILVVRNFVFCVCTRAGGRLEKLFATGQRVPNTGVYLVIHQAHRLPHECTLIAGEQFPRCAKCAEAVRFECIATAPLWKPEPTRTIILYQLPELPPNDPSSEEEVA